MTTYKLGSGPMVYTPGLIAWAINGAKFKKDRDKLIKIVTESWGIPNDAATALVTGKVPYKIVDDAVVFEVGGS